LNDKVQRKNTWQTFFMVDPGNLFLFIKNPFYEQSPLSDRRHTDHRLAFGRICLQRYRPDPRIDRIGRNFIDIRYNQAGIINMNLAFSRKEIAGSLAHHSRIYRSFTSVFGIVLK
jgi:hypothetical protein